MAGRGAGGGGGESVTKLIHGQSGISYEMYYGLSVAKKGGLIMDNGYNVSGVFN